LTSAGFLRLCGLVACVPLKLTSLRIGSNKSFSLLGLARFWRVRESPTYWWLVPTNLRASSDGLIGLTDMVMLVLSSRMM
jgi:hypothetical protein